VRRPDEDPTELAAQFLPQALVVARLAGVVERGQQVLARWGTFEAVTSADVSSSVSVHTSRPSMSVAIAMSTWFSAGGRRGHSMSARRVVTSATVRQRLKAVTRTVDSDWWMATLRPAPAGAGARAPRRDARCRDGPVQHRGDLGPEADRPHLVEESLLTEEQVRKALRIQARLEAKKPLATWSWISAGWSRPASRRRSGATAGSSR